MGRRLRPELCPMGILSLLSRFVTLINSAQSAGDLESALVQICIELGFQYFALTHHVDILRAGARAIRLHNYPNRWADYYDSRALGVSDPVHRMSHTTRVGFQWSIIPDRIPLTRNDKLMLSLGRDQGIGDGFTIPANVPGEARGSVSFVNATGRPLPVDMLPVAELIGGFAFEAARRIWGVRSLNVNPPPSLTDRQRDCVLWAGRGKGDWEISRILDVSEETVTRHITHGCGRYGVNKRALLFIRTLADGTLTLEDFLPG
ncbi:LuxR family transcriptional regulator [Sphingomonas pruni]|uniref:LuxR family transcriptional regulator n=1 Tax=Sphingomonas pruni TaxID=40683 RepID=UPI001FE1893C|nr:LuxR family transcriptional regulator [Sphingomonas pruni]